VVQPSDSQRNKPVVFSVFDFEYKFGAGAIAQLLLEVAFMTVIFCLVIMS
jgi:hypothetical protein